MMSGIAKVQNRMPKPKSKRQQLLKENPKQLTILACKNCERSDVTLIKATDSYYCKECFANLKKEKFEKKGSK